MKKIWILYKMTRERGKFIVLEGINGCGKSTQMDLLSSYLRKSGKAVPIFLTGEPNDFDENGNKAREILNFDNDPYTKAIEATNYFAKNRLSHKKIINPLLENKVIVICDRNYHSNFAFQHAQGVSYDDIAKANKCVLVPDLTLLINTNVKECFRRLSRRDTQRRKFDRNFDFMKRAHENYLELPKILPDLMNDNNIRIINGNGQESFVFYQIKKNLDELFNL